MRILIALITTFSIPNTHEDIREFNSYAVWRMAVAVNVGGALKKIIFNRNEGGIAVWTLDKILNKVSDFGLFMGMFFGYYSLQE